MRTTIRLIATLCLLGVAWQGPSVSAEVESDRYTPPVLTEVPFDPDEIKFQNNTNILYSLKMDGAILVRNVNLSNAAKSKILAISLGIDPEFDIAKSANVILSQGERPPVINVTNEGNAVPNEEIYKNYVNSMIFMLGAAENEHEKMLTAMVLDAVVEINPENTDFRTARDQYHNTNGSPPWDSIFAEKVESIERMVVEVTPLPETITGLQLTTNQSQIRSLLVIQIAPMNYAGKVSPLTATFLKSAEGTHHRRLRFNQTVGNHMSGSLSEISNFMEVRHGEWLEHGVIEFAFQEKHSLKDGDSAGVACGLLVESLITGEDLHKEFACTGALNVDGSVQPIGGVVAKLRAAEKAGTEVIAIPYNNRYAISDLTVLGEASVLSKVQVFIIKDFDEATELAFTDRGEKVQTAIADFAGLQSQFATKGVMNVIRTEEAKKTLTEILERVPHHASARMMILASQGQLPKQLSLNGSLEEIFALFADQTKLLEPLPSLLPIQYVDIEEFEAVSKGFRDMYRKLDARTQPIAKAMAAFSDTCVDIRESTIKTPNDQAQARIQLLRGFDDIFKEMEKIQNDPELIEELITR